VEVVQPMVGLIKFFAVNRLTPSPRCGEPLQPAALASGSLTRTKSCDTLSVEPRGNARAWGLCWWGPPPLTIIYDFSTARGIIGGLYFRP
jgi:hypothetical protein